MDILAPRRSTDEQDDTHVGKEKQEERVKKEASENEDPVYRQRKRKLDAQWKLEEEAKSRGAFAKKQRVKYYHKTTGKWYDDAHVVGVHFDDGPDKPYYVSLSSNVSLSQKLPPLTVLLCDYRQSNIGNKTLMMVRRRNHGRMWKSKRRRIV